MKLLSLRVGPLLFSALVMLVPLVHLGYPFLAARAGLDFLSEKELVDAYHQREPNGHALYYLDYLPVSASYYSDGTAQVMTLGGQQPLPDSFWLAVHKTLGNRAPGRCQLALHPQTGLFNLYRCHD